MNKSAFLKLIQQVSNISDQQTEELEKVAAAFPYCQTAHLLLAKSAYDKGSMLSTQRLRRASSYATDRQLLKRIIYTLPDHTLVTEEPTPEPEVDHTPAAEPNEVILEQETHTLPVNQEDTKITDTSIPHVEEELPEVENQVYTLQDHFSDYTFEDSADDDSELSSLLQINSLSPSFTDLLAQAPEEVNKTEAEELNFQNTDTFADAPALALPVADENDASQEEPEEEVNFAIVDILDCTFQSIDDRMAVSASDDTPEASIEVEEPPQPEPTLIEDEQAEINYSMDEIDRLYAEDMLGYWMSSSRMGEVLQLKDDYTRQKPQSFHPELILEYSKTHELEKAVQPGNNVLSEQLSIIDQFLKLNPRLKTMANMKIKSEPQEDLSLKGTKIKKGIASESLATIFLKQGKTKKAIKIYELLILKYPEKKSYFAEQIEKLQTQI